MSDQVFRAPLILEYPFTRTTGPVVGLQFFIAMGVYNGDLWARVLGIVSASLNVLAQMSFMSVYPSWAWFIIAIDALIIYGLSVHGDEVAEF